MKEIDSSNTLKEPEFERKESIRLVNNGRQSVVERSSTES